MANDRWLIAGLGNPGAEYSHNRHNVGYWCINRLARLHGIKIKAKTLATLGEGDVRGVPAVLLKPRTYMNKSGEAIGPALRRWKIDPTHLIVVYDELDLPAGRVRIKPGARIRVGIGRPHVDGEPTWEPKHVADYVLSDPSPQMVKTLQDAAKRATEAVETIITEGVEDAMNEYNR